MCALKGGAQAQGGGWSTVGLKRVNLRAPGTIFSRRFPTVNPSPSRCRGLFSFALGIHSTVTSAFLGFKRVTRLLRGGVPVTYSTCYRRTTRRQNGHRRAITTVVLRVFFCATVVLSSRCMPAVPTTDKWNDRRKKIDQSRNFYTNLPLFFCFCFFVFYF